MGIAGGPTRSPPTSHGLRGGVSAISGEGLMQTAQLVPKSYLVCKALPLIDWSIQQCPHFVFCHQQRGRDHCRPPAYAKENHCSSLPIGALAEESAFQA